MLAARSIVQQDALTQVRAFNRLVPLHGILFYEKVFTMGLFISFFTTIILCLLLAKPIKKAPGLFYVISIVIAVFGIYFTWNQNPNALVRVFAFEIQKGHIGFSMFALVMFTGVFDQGSNVRRLLNPVRSQLSIMASILIAGHFIPYLKNYIDAISSLFVYPLNLILSFLIAVVIFVLLVILFITSINVVRNRMKGGSWKKIQQLAYPFFILVYLHLTGYLLGSAIHGSAGALVNWIFYSAIFVLYTVLRLIKFSRDKKRNEALKQSGTKQSGIEE